MENKQNECIIHDRRGKFSSGVAIISEGSICPSVMARYFSDEVSAMRSIAWSWVGLAIWDTTGPIHQTTFVNGSALSFRQLYQYTTCHSGMAVRGAEPNGCYRIGMHFPIPVSVWVVGYCPSEGKGTLRALWVSSHRLRSILRVRSSTGRKDAYVRLAHVDRKKKLTYGDELGVFGSSLLYGEPAC